MYSFLLLLLRCCETSQLITQDEIDLLVEGYRQLVSFEISIPEYHALMLLTTDTVHPIPENTVLEIKRPLFLQLAVRLCRMSTSIFTRELLLQEILDLITNTNKKTNMRAIKYDGIFLDLIQLVPPMDDDVAEPASNPSQTRRINTAISTLQQSTELTTCTEKMRTAIDELIQADCAESYAALIRIYKTNTLPTACRAYAVDCLYDASRTRFGGVVGKIRSLLLEYIMKVFVRFSISSMPVSLLPLFIICRQLFKPFLPTDCRMHTTRFSLFSSSFLSQNFCKCAICPFSSNPILPTM